WVPGGFQGTIRITIRIRIRSWISDQSSFRQSFLHRYVAADDAFQEAVLGAQQECAVRVERFRAAPDQAFARADGDVLADCGAVLLPFVGNGIELTAANEIVIRV